MAARVEPIAEVALPEVAAWVREAAEAEGVDVAVIVERALVRERARAQGRRIDSRTKQPGRNGMDARVGPGERHGGHLAELAGVSHARIETYRKARAICSIRPTARGHVAVYDGRETLIAVALGALESAVGPLCAEKLAAVGDLVRERDRAWRGVWLALTPKGPALAGDNALGEFARNFPAVALVSMEAASRAVARASLFA